MLMRTVKMTRNFELMEKRTWIRRIIKKWFIADLTMALFSRPGAVDLRGGVKQQKKIIEFVIIKTIKQ